MTTALSSKPGRGNFARGTHPPGRKQLSAGQAIEAVPAPAQVKIPLLQHTGAPCEATVKPRDKVTLGQTIGDCEAFISAPVHASIAGTAGVTTAMTLPNGRHVQAVPIKAEGEQLQGQALLEDHFGGDWPTDASKHQPKQIVEAVRGAGLVGLGGAAFPTHVKLTPPKGKTIDTLLVNGCECEPYLTADYRLMLEHPRPIVSGALLAARACGAGRVIVAIEDNKRDAAEAVRVACEGTNVQVAVLKTKYPMGGERQAIPAALGREVPTGGLPLDVGVVVVNVGTAATIARAVLRGKPLTHRVVTVTGAGVERPKNLFVPIGISYGEIIDYCGRLTDDAARVVAGGPMMGHAITDMDTPVTKGTSGVTVLTHADIHRAKETACMRCGRCVDVCPLHLVPTKLAQAARGRDWELAERYSLTACCECGCCAYVCPASLPLVQLIRTAKAIMPKK